MCRPRNEFEPAGGHSFAQRPKVVDERALFAVAGKKKYGLGRPDELRRRAEREVRSDDVAQSGGRQVSGELDVGVDVGIEESDLARLQASKVAAFGERCGQPGE